MSRVLLLLLSSISLSAATVESLLTPLVTGKSPGLAVLVRKDGHTVFERGYGLRQLRSEAKIGSRTNFRLASFTKQFTALGVILLVKDGKLRFDQPLTEIFPDFPAYARSITIRHLLSHTSGLPDYEDLMEGGPWTADKQIQDDEVLKLLKNETKPKFVTGSQWSYSNSGYVVLGLVIAKVSGKDYGTFLQERIFKPLGMKHTVVYVKGKNTVPDRAYGHVMKDGQFVESDQSSTSATLGDGGIYSNLRDLAKWDESLTRHTLVPESMLREAWTAAKLTDGSPVKYGMGWHLDSGTSVYHTGSTMGFRTIIQRWPDEKLSVIILANRADVDTAKLAKEIRTTTSSLE